MSRSDEDIARATTPMFAYGDGSGFEMTVRITRRENDQWEVGIRSVNQWCEFDAEKWPAVRDEVNRLLSHFANRAPTQEP